MLLIVVDLCNQQLNFMGLNPVDLSDEYDSGLHLKEVLRKF